MNSRERVLTALKHREPDRVPVDLGGMDSTGIMAAPYNALKAHLGIEGGRTRIYDTMQQVAKVEPEVLRAVGGDVVNLSFEPRRWRDSVLPDGSPCQVAEKWAPEALPDGSEVVRDREGNVTMRRLAGSYYFEPVYAPLAEVTEPSELAGYGEEIEGFDLPLYADQTLDEMGERARELYETTDRAVMGCFIAHVFMGGQLLRGFDNFLMDLVANPALADAVMDALVDAYIARFDRYIEAVGPYIQIIQVSDDLGMQDGPQISPETYRERVKPHHARLWGHIKRRSGLPLFLHSCGSVYKLIPDLIEIGLDILNPVQVSAADMDSRKLKEEFGEELTFWGGGCDTQWALPFGTPGQVRDEVRRRIEDLAPGGGFVFNQVHNIQVGVPPENIMAMYETVAEYGVYGVY